MANKKKTNLEIIKENLPLIPQDISNSLKIEIAERKLDFVDKNPGLFNSTGSYIMTRESIKRELKRYNDAKGGLDE